MSTQIVHPTPVQFIWSEICDRDVDQCIDLLKYMLQKVTVILTRCNSLSDAIRIFTVTTTRGLNLEPIDIVKATIWESIPEDLHVSRCFLLVRNSVTKRFRK